MLDNAILCVSDECREHISPFKTRGEKYSRDSVFNRFSHLQPQATLSKASGVENPDKLKTTLFQVLDLSCSKFHLVSALLPANGSNSRFNLLSLL